MSQHLPEMWRYLSESESVQILRELQRELCSSHELFNVEARALARHENLDDFLFELQSKTDSHVVVHLTWNLEQKPQWPHATWFTNLEDFKCNANCRLYE
jgi:hypothetical protein